MKAPSKKGASDYIFIKGIVNNGNIKLVNIYSLILNLKSKHYWDLKEKLVKEQK